jgi:AsmA protein
LFELPFMVQGSWDDPIILPDPQSRIQRSGAAQPILDAVRSRTNRDSVRSAIERLTGAAPAQPSETAPALAGASAPAQEAPPAAETEAAPDTPPSDSR